MGGVYVTYVADIDKGLIDWLIDWLRYFKNKNKNKKKHI